MLKTTSLHMLEKLVLPQDQEPTPNALILGFLRQPVLHRISILSDGL